MSRAEAYYRDGIRSYLDGRPLSDAPAGQSEARSWRSGWYAARRDYGEVVPRGPRERVPAARLVSEAGE